MAHTQTTNNIELPSGEMINVEYTITPVIPASWDEPAEGGEIEVVQVYSGEDDSKIELSEADHEYVFNWLCENAEYEDDEPDYERD